MAGCGSKKMAKGGMVKKAKGGMMISPRKAMAMGKKPSGSKAKVKKFAAGGMVGGIRAPTTGPLPGANPRVVGGPQFRIQSSITPQQTAANKAAIFQDLLAVQQTKRLAAQQANRLAAQQVNRVNLPGSQSVRGFKKGGAVKKGK